jgi:2-hydroxy-3-keto-5-methylthiopentenyl-1-phosphate phosphatase
MKDFLSLKPQFRFLTEEEVHDRLARVVEQAMTPANLRYSYTLPRKIVFANMDDVLCQNLGKAACMVAKVDTEAVDQARADGKISKAEQVWHHFRGLLVERGLDLPKLVENVVRDHQVFPGVFKMRERFTQIGVGMMAISNGMESFLQAALERHHRLEIPIFAQDLLFEEGAYWGLELVHGQGMIDKGEIVNLAASRHRVQPVACIGDGVSDIPMAQAVYNHGGFIVSCGEKSPLTLWCREHNLVEGKDFLVYDRKGGLHPEMRHLITGLVPSVPHRRALAA